LLRELDCSLVRNAQRVLEHVGAPRERRCYLGGALEIESLVVVQPVGVGEILAEPDAEEDVMRVVIFAPEEMSVVGSEHWDADFFGELEDAAIEGVLILGSVRLHLEVVAVAKHLGVPRCGRAGLIVFIR
jgi:hypothetical protein